MVRQSPSRPSILQVKRPLQGIANPGYHDGKDEDRRSHDGEAGTGTLEASFIARCRLRPGGSWNFCGF